MSTREDALALLGQNLPQHIVAQTLGVSEGLISQLLSDDGFKEELQALRAASLKKDFNYDEKLDDLEERFLDIVETRAPTVGFRDALFAYKTLNAARRRKDTVQPQQQLNVAQVINITLSQAASAKYVLNSQSEIVDVEGKAMVAISPQNLEKLVKEKAPALPLKDKETAAALLSHIPLSKREIQQLPSNVLVDLL